MHGYLERLLASTIEQRLRRNPVVAILGPRQCGKSTLATKIVERYDGAVHLDLERASDRAKLRDAEAFFRVNRGRLVCLDEIQRVPDLFEALRPAVDETGAPGQFLVLGSASRDLIRQSSESLAGRIAYLELTPFMIGEVEGLDDFQLRRLWLRGGFPRSYLAEDDGASFDWRTDFVRTFIERDLPLIGPRVETQRMERLWRMAAHVHGQLLNSSKLGESLGVSYHTVRAYFELLEQTFVVRLLQPFEGNVKKRLVKSPKLYLRDAGVLHALLGIRDQNELLGHPAYGASFEGLVIEHALSGVRDWRAGFYRTSGGAEIDLVLERPGRRHRM